MKIYIKGVIVDNDDKWIYDYLGMDATCPNDIKGAIENANDGELIDAYINSGGGDIFAASEIYAALRECRKRVAIHVTGIAASAASVIMCAGVSDITPTGMVMVHNVSSAARGDYHVMDKNSLTLQRANQAIAAAYREKTGKSEKEILEMMDSETWMTAEQAVKYGLVDGITKPNIQLAASYGGQLLAPEVIAKIKNMTKNPRKTTADFFMEKEKAQLEVLKLGGIRE